MVLDTPWYYKIKADIQIKSESRSSLRYNTVVYIQVHSSQQLCNDLSVSQLDILCIVQATVSNRFGKCWMICFFRKQKCECLFIVCCFTIWWQGRNLLTNWVHNTKGQKFVLLDEEKILKFSKQLWPSTYFTIKYRICTMENVKISFVPSTMEHLEQPAVFLLTHLVIFVLFRL